MNYYKQYKLMFNVPFKLIITVALATILMTSSIQLILMQVVSATETGTWVDGNMPQIQVGGAAPGASPSTCYPSSLIYQSYTNTDGSWSNSPRDITQSACAAFANPGLYGGSGSTSYGFVAPGTSYAFRILDGSGNPTSVYAVPNQNTYIYSLSDGNLNGGRSLRFFDSFAAIGNFGKNYVSRSGTGSTYEMAYKFSSTPSPLRDNANNILHLMDAYAYSNNGTWMLAEINSLGILRINTQTRQVQLIDSTYKPTYGLGWRPFTTLAISDDGNTAILGGHSASTTVYDLSGCQSSPFTVGGSNNATPGCRSRNVQTSITSQVPGYYGLLDMRFSPDGKSISGRVKIYNSATGTYDIKAMTYSVAGYQSPLAMYLALGDSFSSGEGAYNYLSSTDVSSPKNKCHTSQNSYPYLTATGLGISNTAFVNMACSGAKMMNNYFTEAQYDNVTMFTWTPGESTQRDFARSANASAITLSMGGNDIGFSNKITRCVAVSDSCYHFLEDRKSIANEIYNKFDNLASMYKSIKTESNGAKVYVLGYPQMFSTNNQCDPNVRLDPEERAFSRGLVTYLNAVIRAATEKAGVKYIDVENALSGHQHCDGAQVAVNGLLRGDGVPSSTFGPIASESYHPNQYGHQLLRDALTSQSQNLSAAMPAVNDSKTAPYTGSTAYNSLIGSAPSGSTIKRQGYVASKIADVVYKNTLMGISPLKEALKPSTAYEVWFNSTPTYAGSLTTNALGELSGDITVPANIEPGIHTIHIYGKDLSDKDVDLYKTVYVGANENDIDGDGILNENEKCLDGDPANSDIDNDGIDDACDGEIADTVPPTITLNNISDGAIVDLSATPAPSCTATDSGTNDTPVSVSCTVSYNRPAVYGQATTVEYTATATDASNNTATLTGTITVQNAQGISPTLECVSHSSATSHVARFGFNNPNWIKIEAPVGSFNNFSPSPEDRGQTIIFDPGQKQNAFEVTFTSGAQAWNLTSNVITADENSTSCP